MILETQIQNVGARGRTRVKLFIFKKFQGAQILIFFCENWHEASFYIKKQTQDLFLNLSFKNYYFGPPKKRVLSFWRKA